MTKMQATEGAPTKVKFEDCTIAFAIDTSGSTSMNSVLTLEQHAVSELSSKLSPSARLAARVLPWATTADDPIPLSSLKSLESYGGTDPKSLLMNRSCRETLQQSTMWFLLTDGEIFESAKQEFARQIATHGLHGTACVVTIFGPIHSTPARCNISVGVSIFAAAPDCLFLFYDTASKRVYLLQCSGRFTQILELYNKTQPILDDSTEWADLPIIQLTDLANISIPAPRALSKDQIALPSGFTLNLKDLFEGRLTDDSTINRIFEDDDNLKSIMLTAQTRGETDAFRKWLQPFTDPASSPLKAQADIEQKALETIDIILAEMKSGVSQERIQKLEVELRKSQNHVSLSGGQSVSERFESISRSSQAALTRSSQTSNHAVSISSLVSLRPSRSDYSQQSAVVVQHLPLSPEVTDELHGICELCGSYTNLALLLRKPPSDQKTSGLPFPNDHTPLTYPLAIGNFPETDIISSSMSCNACSINLMLGNKTILAEDLTGAIPLVRYTDNSQTIKIQLKIGLLDRFAEADLPQIYLAILVNTMQRLPSTNSHKLLKRAIRWSCKDLLENAMISSDLLSGLASPVPHSGKASLRDAFENSLSGTITSESESVFRYPLPGFVVMVLGLHLAQDTPHLTFSLQKQVWHRLLYQITHSYQLYLITNGPLVTQYKMADILLEKQGLVNEKSRHRNSLKSFRDLRRTLFGDRYLSNVKTSIDLDTLVTDEMLNETDVLTLRTIGDSFKTLEQNTKAALCVYLHFLARQSNLETSPWQVFRSLRDDTGLSLIFESPMDVRTRNVANIVKDLSPPLVLTGEFDQDVLVK